MAGNPMTAIATKFPRRRDGFYHLDDKKYASVTEILSILAKPALVPWAARTAAALVLDDPFKYDTAEKASGAIYAVRDKAADRGSTIHSLAEAIVRSGQVDLDSVPEQFRGYGVALNHFWRDFRPTVIETEANVYSDEHMYAGTTDLICEIGGRTHLCDYKTGKDIYKEAALQLCAYRYADFILTKDTPPIRLDMPDIEATAVVLLGDDGTFLFKEVDAPFDAFLAAKRLWQWTKEAR